MRALVSHPPTGGAELREVATPPLPPGGVRVRVAEVGVCGTDQEIVAGRYGRVPDGADHLVLGHENLGTVVERAAGVQELTPGDLVVATVRRGCGACRFCAANRSDFCETGRYTERGIWRADGYLAEEYVETPAYLVKVPPSIRGTAVLVEPLSVVEKATEQGFGVLARMNAPSAAPAASPPAALVAGTGAIGMLASLVLRVRGWRVTAIDRHPSGTPAAGVLGAIGARHVDASAGSQALGSDRFELIVEATGSANLDVSLLDLLGPNGTLVLTGIPDPSAAPSVAMGARLRGLVLENQAVVGSVNANRTHFAAAVADLGRFEALWPGVTSRLIGERRPWEEFGDVFARRTPGLVKSVLVVGAAGDPPSLR